MEYTVLDILHALFKAHSAPLILTIIITPILQRRNWGQEKLSV